MDRIGKTLDIIDRILAMVEFEQCTEALADDEVVDECTNKACPVCGFAECDEEGKWIDEILRKECEDYDEDEEDEEREDITETVVDNSPNKLKEENKHLKNLLDIICDGFGLEQYELEDGTLGISWEKGLLDEIAKARKKLNK